MKQLKKKCIPRESEGDIEYVVDETQTVEIEESNKIPNHEPLHIDSQILQSPGSNTNTNIVNIERFNNLANRRKQEFQNYFPDSQKELSKI